MNEWMQMDESGLVGFQRQSLGAEKRRGKVASAVSLWADLLSGRAPGWMLQEALAPRTPAAMQAIEANYPGIVRIGESQTTSDFPYLTGDVLDRMLLARYRAFPSPWRQFAKVVTTLRDFRTVSRFAADGLEGTWNSVPEEGELEYGAMSETRYQYTPAKYAKGTHLSWEMIMNDDLGAFQDIPDRLARGGARTVNKFVTGLYVDASGPHASLYTGGVNQLTGNPAFSVTALGTAFAVLGGFTDAGGDPIYVEEAVLVVPPALRVAAENVMNQITVDVSAGETNRVVQVNNWIVGNLQMVVDPYIPIVASSANGSTSWFLFADPNASRPALEVGFISGFAEPVLYQKLANTIRVGGGIDQMAGDFSTMSQEYKGVLAFGGGRLDTKATVASNGSGA